VKWLCQCGEEFAEPGDRTGYWALVGHIRKQGGAANGHRYVGLFDDEGKQLARNYQQAIKQGLISGPRGDKADDDAPDQEPQPEPPATDKEPAKSNGKAEAKSVRDLSHRDFMHGEVKSRASSALTFDVGGGRLQFPHWVMAYALVLMPIMRREDGSPYTHSAEGFAAFITDVLRESFRRLLPLAIRDRLERLGDENRRLVVRSYIAALESLDDVQLAALAARGMEKVNPEFAKALYQELASAAKSA
jgi:hypothetical protein